MNKRVFICRYLVFVCMHLLSPTSRLGDIALSFPLSLSSRESFPIQNPFLARILPHFLSSSIACLILISEQFGMPPLNTTRKKSCAPLYSRTDPHDTHTISGRTRGRTKNLELLFAAVTSNTNFACTFQGILMLDA